MWLKHREKFSYTFVPLYTTVTLCQNNLTATQITCAFFTVFGTTFNYDMHVIGSFVEEDGEIKLLHCKDFTDPKQRDALFAGTVKAAAERVAA